MFKAGELEAVSMALEPQFRELEQRIMSDVVRRIKINGEVTRAADWQITRLAQLGESKREIKKTIKDTLGLSTKEINHLYKDIIRKGYERDSDLYKYKGRTQIPFAENHELQQLLGAVSKQTNSELKNITQSLGFAKRGADGKLTFTPVADYYQKTLDSAMLDISSGAFDYNTVLKRTVKEMTNSGLRTVDYATGRSNRVDVAARRAVMTGMSQLTAKVNDSNAEQLGTDTFEVTAHGGARPEHQEWQGKWYTKDELESICGLGEVTGLCGANCYHDYYPVVPGISKPTYTPEEIEEFNRKENEPVEYNGKKYTKYEATQRQRKLETTMRAQRQEIKLLKEGGANEDDLIAARSHYRGTSAEYARFSKAMDLPQQRERVTVDGLGNIGQGKYTKADNVNNKSVDKTEKDGTIKIEIDEYVPCLRDNATGQLVNTEVSQVFDYTQLANYNEQNGWGFPWSTPPKDTEVYALRVENKTDIEGLIALRKEPQNAAVYMYWGNAAPHNQITSENSQKRYNGVGGHLFAIAADVSLKEGYGGYIYADAANAELFNVFVEKYNATPMSTRDRPYRFCFDGQSLVDILRTYNFDWR